MTWGSWGGSSSPLFALLVAFVIGISPAMAVQPDEILDDPVLEERARDLSEGLRCLVCRNESIDESSAPLARDLRLLVRERLVEGDSDAEVIDYVVDRYGEYVLLNPPATGSTLLLWGTPLLLLLIGGAVAVRHVRGQRATVAEGLSEAEEARVRELLNKD
jgi:cytochrome c-type biogenesis protein CcmH